VLDRRRHRLAFGLLGVILLTGATLATMSWSEPPRYDGAGYATLGRALAEGRGYRVISLPDAPRHAHFPPGYPGLLAVVWMLAGTDDVTRFTILAHGLSLACLAIGVGTVGCWWSATEPRGVAVCLTLALAWNWTWVRTGGVIRSEPLAIALGGLILLAARGRSSGSLRGQVVLALLLGAGVLTRQVTACWALAVAVDLGLRRGWIKASLMLAGVAVVVAPWVAWQLAVGSDTQSSLFRPGGMVRLIGEQGLFYARRIPDAIAGPFVEVATVFGRSSRLATGATLVGVAVTGIILLGWVRSVRSPRRRLGGLIPLATFPLLLVWPFTEAGRFLIPLVPFLLLGAVEGGAVILGRCGVARPRLWASRLILAASLPYSIYAVATQRSAAERQTQRGFDAACAWIKTHREPPGTIMARHPADVAWLTGRLAVAIPEGGPDRIAEVIRVERVVFLVVDDERYARSPANPLRELVNNPRQSRKVWDDGGTTSVYQVEPTLAP